MIRNLLLTFFLLTTISVTQAQCRWFAKTMGLANLDTATFHHDGRFNAIMLMDGQEIEFFKTVNAGNDYRFLLVADTIFKAPLHFTVMDFERNVIFRNDSGTNNRFWDFSEQQNRRLIISVSLPAEITGEMQAKGCVAVLVGSKK